MVEKIADTTKRPLKSIIGDRAFLKSLKPAEFASAEFGIPTVTDILAELEKPGRDPRPEFKTASFQEGVDKISDLKPGMQLEGVVTNVAAFGAFVDVGVHQDGLVHISELSDRFVKDPREVVKAGDVVKVRVKDVDVATQAHRADDEVGRHRSLGRCRVAQLRARIGSTLQRPAAAPGFAAAGRERLRRRPAPRPGTQVRRGQSALIASLTSPMGRGRRTAPLPGRGRRAWEHERRVRRRAGHRLALRACRRHGESAGPLTATSGAGEIRRFPRVALRDCRQRKSPAHPSSTCQGCASHGRKGITRIKERRTK